MSMTLPPNGPATLPQVKARLGLAVDDLSEDADLDLIVRAVNAKVRTWPCVQVADLAADWSGDAVAAVVLGSVMLAARVYRRRNTPDGVQAFGNLGAVYVQRNDPDVGMLLGLGASQKPTTA